MSIVNEFEEHRQRFREMWINLEPRIKGDLVNIWVYHEQLEEIRLEEKKLLPLVIELLEKLSNTPESERLGDEYRKHAKHLLSLLKHAQSTEGWRDELIAELDGYVLATVDHVHSLIEARKRGDFSATVKWSIETLPQLWEEFDRRVSRHIDELNALLQQDLKPIEAWFRRVMHDLPIGAIEWLSRKNAIVIVYINIQGRGGMCAYAFPRIGISLSDIPTEQKSGNPWFRDTQQRDFRNRKVKKLLREAKLITGKDPTGFEIMLEGSVESELSRW